MQGYSFPAAKVLGLEKNMLRIIISFLAIMNVVSLPPAVKALDKLEIYSLYNEGTAAFRQANDLTGTDEDKARGLYRKSVLLFERLVYEGNIVNGKLFYNIGNIYFRLGDLGRAILYYRSAEKLIPNDANLQQNLDYARTRRLDRIEEKPQTQVFKTLFFWHYDLSRFTRLVLFLVSFNAIWVMAAMRLFRRRNWLRYGIVTGVVLSVLTAASLGVEAYQEARSRAGVILAEQVVARKGDSTTYQPSFAEPIHAGTEFVLLEQRRGWYNIELADGRSCWIPESAAGLLLPE